jgi:hypothetical protein
MSYARMSDDSDVYIFEHAEGFIQCCGCSIIEPDDYEIVGFANLNTAREALAHLDAHVALGHKVPQKAFERIREEHENLDAQIEKYVAPPRKPRCSYCGKRAAWTLFHRNGNESRICDECDRPDDVRDISKVGLESKNQNTFKVQMSDNVKVFINPKSGSIKIAGAVDLVDIEGNVLETVTNIKLCGCGLTKEKPICDGAHKHKMREV